MNDAKVREICTLAGLALDANISLAATITPTLLLRLAGRSPQAGTTLPSAPRSVAPESIALDQTQVDVASLRTLAVREQLPGVSLWLPGSPAMGAAPDPGKTSDLVVTEQLGVGGMGAVFLAEQRSLRRQVAVKTIGWPIDAGLAAALVSEAAIVGHLEHPNIPPIHALGVAEDGRPVIVMKRVTGVSWSQLLEDDDDPSWARVRTATSDRLASHIDILRQVARAAEFAHARGYVHRDIKPDNVMVGELGDAYLVDWGIATPLSDEGSGELVGTPHFMAPEMVEGKQVGPHTDVFLLGAALHVVLTRQPLHAGGSLVEVLSRAIVCAPHEYDESLPADLRALAQRATARSADERPSSALAFHDALVAHVTNRASLSLCESAQHRLLELEALVSREGELEIRACNKLATEARFGFLEALRTWPSNVSAKDGLARCARAMTELELRRGDPEAARAWAAEAGDAADQLERIEALERRLEKDKSDAEALRKRAHDTSGRVAARGQYYAGVGMTGFTLVVGVISELTGDRASSVQPTGLRAVVIIGLTMLAVIGLTVTLGRRSFVNALSRRMYVAIAAGFAVMLLHRVGARHEGEILAHTLRDEWLIMGGICTTIGVIAYSAWIWGGLTLIATAVVMFFFPEEARTLANFSPTMVCVVIVLTSRGAALEPPRTQA